MDEKYYASKDYRLEDIEVPVLSVTNWGGINLHLRGNVEGYKHAGSKLKYLLFITGRLDLPLHYDEGAELQRSFLDAFLKDDDRLGWATPGKVPPVSVVLREGDVGCNNADAERVYKRREEEACLLPSTQYQKWYLSLEKKFELAEPSGESQAVQWNALDESPAGIVSYATAPFQQRIKFTGHVTAHLNVSVGATDSSTPPPSDLDLFVTIRHISVEGREIFYTGTAGDPCPVAEGWLRCSLRAVNTSHPWHRSYLPRREYRPTDVSMLEADEVYEVDVGIWLTNVVVSEGAKLVFEIAGANTSGTGISKHENPEDRAAKRFKGINKLHFGVAECNHVVLPHIPGGVIDS